MTRQKETADQWINVWNNSFMHRLNCSARCRNVRLDVACEMSRSYPSKLEKGEYYASLKIIGRLAETLMVEPAEFLKATNENPGDDVIEISFSMA